MSISTKLSNNLKILGNLQCILEKMQKEGFLPKLQIVCEDIFENEWDFTRKELMRIEKKLSTRENMFQLSNNMLIFKENFKVIMMNLSELNSWGSLVQQNRG